MGWLAKERGCVGSDPVDGRLHLALAPVGRQHAPVLGIAVEPECAQALGEAPHQQGTFGGRHLEAQALGEEIGETAEVGIRHLGFAQIRHSYTNGVMRPCGLVHAGAPR